MVANFLNFVLFQLVWLGTIMGVANDIPWLGAPVLALFLIAHYFLSPTAKADYLAAVIAMPIGFLVETAYVRSGLLDYKFATLGAGLAPIWIIWLWANLALTMNNCLGWLHGRNALAVGAGIVAGPLTYLAGARLGAAELGTELVPAFVAFAASWAVLVPVLLVIASRTRTWASSSQTIAGAPN